VVGGGSECTERTYGKDKRFFRPLEEFINHMWRNEFSTTSYWNIKKVFVIGATGLFLKYGDRLFLLDS